MLLRYSCIVQDSRLGNFRVSHPLKTAIRVQAKASKRADKTLIIVNPNSCSGLTGKNWDSLYAQIKQILGDDLLVAVSKRPGDGTIIARKYLKRGFAKIVAIGGDGTLNEVANGFFEEPVGIFGQKATVRLKPINPDAVMAIVPCGTRNVLAKSLGLPQGVVECCRTFSLGTPKKVDVVVAIATDAKDGSAQRRVVLNAAEIGLGAEIIDRSKKVRKAVNSRLLSTVAGIIATVPAYQSNKCEISITGSPSKMRKLFTNMTMAVISNGMFLGGGFRAAPKADMTDGLLDLVMLKDSGSLKVLDELVNLKEGQYGKDDNALYVQARKISISSKDRDVTVTVDGEPIGVLPATFQIVPGALTIRM